jgi:hypothetical protein
MPTKHLELHPVGQSGDRPSTQHPIKEQHMIRNFKLGVAVLAVLALTAVGASAAQAASSLDVGAAPAFLEGAQVSANNKLAINNSEGTTVSTVKCSTATLKGTSTTTNVTSQLVAPTYGTCTLGGLTAEIKVNGCEYRLTSTTTEKQANADVVCAESKKIEIIQGSCVITVGSQEGLSAVTFANEGSGSTADVLATLNVKNVALTGGSGCPTNLVGTGNKGVLSGTQTVKAFKDESGVKGAQVSLSAT